MPDSNVQPLDPVIPDPSTNSTSPLPGPVIHRSPFRIVTPLLVGGLIIILVIILYFVLRHFNVFPLINSLPATPTPTTITVWGLNDPPQILEPLIVQFEQANPHLNVEYVQETLTDYRQRLAIGINQGQGPDVFTFHHSWVPMLSSLLSPMPAEVAQNLNPQTTYYPALLQPLTTSSGLVGLPLSADALGLFYNKTLFESAGLTPPTDWEELRTSAKALTVAIDEQITQSGIALGTTNNIDFWPDIIGLLMLQQGVELHRPDTQLGQNTLRFYTNFVLQDRVWDPAMPPSTYAFANGTTAMMIAPSFQTQNVLSINPNLNFAIAPVPQLYGTTTHWATFWAWGVSGKTSRVNQQAAWQFLQYLSQKEVLRQHHAQSFTNTNFGFAFPRQDMADQLTTSPYVSYISQAMPTARTWYLNAGTKDFGLNDSTIEVYKGIIDAIIEGVPPAEAVKAAPGQLDQIMAQYRLR